MNLKTLFFYTLYCITALMILGYTLFPRQEVAQWLTYRINSMNSDFKMKITDVRPVFPPGIASENIEITVMGTNKVLIKSLTLKPVLTSVFSTLIKADISAVVLNGSLKGRLSVSLPDENNTGKKIPIDVGTTLKFKDLAIENFKYKTPEADIILTFFAAGDIDFKTMGTHTSSGSGVLKISQVRAIVNHPVLNQFNLSQFNFNTVDIEFIMDKNTIDINTLLASGDELTLNGQGVIKLKNPYHRSVLNLRGTFFPEPSYLKNFAGISPVRLLFEGARKGGIPFSIKGSAQNPVFGL